MYHSKSLRLESNPLGKSFIYTTKSNGPKIYEACFWEMSLLNHNIFQRDQDVLT